MDPLRLVGTWHFVRDVRDHRDGADYAASGTAALVLQDDGRVRWTEHGTLTWASGSTPVSRTLFLLREPHTDDVGPHGRPDHTQAPSGWRVTFEDGRDFHPWTAGAVEHLCGADLYQGGLAIPAGQRQALDVTWHVTGPEKDYTMHTSYTRPPPSGA